MKKVFIVRPFGNRTVIRKDASGAIFTETFDFDEVERQLLKPAIKQLADLEGGTTSEVFEAGDIREDMFSSLLLADLVVADITIHNANVFYELGIRHALRDQKTVLIKCPGYDETPFDILGYKYVTYDKDNPAASLSVLARSIHDTMEADRKDSPVFNVLPELEAQDPEKYFALPKEFIEEVKIAGKAQWVGKLSLLAFEAGDFPWKYHAYRLVGETLYKLKAFRSARRIWELIRNDKPEDVLANDRLATIYQRLAREEMQRNPGEGEEFLARSDRAIERVIANKDIGSRQHAEAYALKARNAKARWLQAWQDKRKQDRKREALQSIFLQEAYEYYRRGFNEDLNHYYSGINALGMLTVILSLAEQDRPGWDVTFIELELAEEALRKYKAALTLLLPTVKFSIACAIARAKASGDDDDYRWAVISEADLAALTAANPEAAKNIYRQALAPTDNLNIDAAINQLKIYAELDVKRDNMIAILNALDKVVVEKGPVVHTILFTGHMIDRPDRSIPRFPPSKEAEVREKIRNAIGAEAQRLADRVTLTAIAGGACGGDILFLEICQELGIPGKMFLAAPRDEFVSHSVAFAGPKWVGRFNDLYAKLPHPELGTNATLPRWLEKRPDYNIWQRNNRWELYSALANGGMNMTLLALWDRKKGDGTGGTADMVREANDRGAKVEIIDL